MTNKELYRSTFEALHVSKERLGKVYQMETSKKSIHPLRYVLLAACLTALLIGSAFAANAMTDGQFFASIRILINGQEAELTRLDENSYRYETESGCVTVDFGETEVAGEDGAMTATSTIEMSLPDDEDFDVEIEVDGAPGLSWPED